MRDIIQWEGMNFYPRSPCGERLKTPCVKLSIDVFLSTLSLRRATLGAGKSYNVCRNFYPRSPCGERPWARGSRVTYVEISIHALLAESDYMCPIISTTILIISIHALLAESDVNDAINGCNSDLISIHALLAESDAGGVPCYLDNIISIHALLAESDCQWRRSVKLFRHFYPRSPCGERLFRQNYECFKWIISIHALLAESDR